MRWISTLSLLLSLSLAALAAVNPPEFSIPPGLYATPQSVTLTAEAGASIYYTLDGNPPTSASTLYTSPIAATEGRDMSSGAISVIQTSSPDETYDPWYPPAEASRTLTVIRAIAIKDDEISTIATASYLIGELATRYTLPIFSVCAAYDDLFTPNAEAEQGIYIYPTMWAKYKNKKGYIELFEHGAFQFGSAVRLRIQGTSTISRPKKSLRVTARTLADKASYFDYPFFPDKATTRYENIVLRNGGNDWCGSMMRDQYAQMIQKHTDVDVQYGRYGIVFLNGVYWGIHEIRERYEDGYFRYQHGGLEGEALGEYTLLEYASEDTQALVDVGWDDSSDGYDSTAQLDFANILNFVKSKGKNLSNPSDYAWVTNRVNVDTLLQHFAASIFTGNHDWTANNQRFWRTFGTGLGKGGDPKNDGRWNWTFHDLDWCFSLDFDYAIDQHKQSGFDSMAFSVDRLMVDGVKITTFANENEDAYCLFEALLTNETFKNKFIDFYVTQLNTAYRPSRLLAELDALATSIRAEVPENSLRWQSPRDQTAWERDVRRMADYARTRRTAARWHLRRFFNLDADAPLTLQNGETGREGSIQVGDSLLNADFPGVEGALAELTYPQNRAITLTAIPATGYQFAGWYQLESETPPPLRAFDQAAHYDSWSRTDSPNRGTGWGNWSWEGNGVFGGFLSSSSSDMAIHHLSSNGRSFGVYANEGSSASLQRLLDNNETLAIGETMSVDVASGTTDSAGKGVAFVDNAYNRPVEWIVADWEGYGPAFRMMLNDVSYAVNDSLRPMFGAPYTLSLTRVADTQYVFCIRHDEETYGVEVTLVNPIRGIRLFKNGSGASADEYNMYFDHLQVSSATIPSATALTSSIYPETITFDCATFYDTWNSGDGAGFGWTGTWDIRNEANSGTFIARNASAQRMCNIGLPAFGLWANNGALVEAARWFNDLTEGTEVSFQFEHNKIQTDSFASVGVVFRYNDQDRLSFYLNNDSPNYWISANDNSIDTGIPATPLGLWITLRVLDNNTYVLSVAGQSFTNTCGTINNIRFFNNNAGPTPSDNPADDRNVYFNNIRITVPVVIEDPDIPDDPDPADPAMDEAANYLEIPWENGATGGSGWLGGWAFEGEEYAGAFIQANAVDNLSMDAPAFGLWSDSGFIGVSREFDAMQIGDVFSFTYDNNDINQGAVGFSFQNTNGDNLIEVFYEQPDYERTNYVLKVNGISFSTPLNLPWTGDGMQVILSLSGSNSFSLILKPTNGGSITRVGTFQGGPIQKIRLFSAYVGGGEARNVYFNNLFLYRETNTAPRTARALALAANGTLLSTNSAITLTLTDAMRLVAVYSLQESSGYAAWVMENGLAGEEAAYDYVIDGISNLERYMLETAITTPAPDSSQAAFVDGEGALYSHVAIPEDVEASIMISNDLIENEWRAATTHDLTPMPGNQYRVQSWTSDTPLFIRLELKPISVP